MESPEVVKLVSGMVGSIMRHPIAFLITIALSVLLVYGVMLVLAHLWWLVGIVFGLAIWVYIVAPVIAALKHPEELAKELE